ncbi:MAG: peptide ABC transporter substrate-binding protein [Clostridium sp.]|nr:peptide ABC transporter substrate-binding protein [Clostridium sp.]
MFSGCNIDLGGLLEQNRDEDYSFLDGSIDDVLDTGPVKGGTLNLFSTIPDTLNPIFTANAFIKDYSCFVYEGLIKLDEKQRPIPVLAKNWEVSDTGLIWTFHLRSDVYWHDNIPFTAEDVEFTAGVIAGAGLDSSYFTIFENIARFTALDSQTFEIELHTPNSFTPGLMTFPIIPKHYYMGENIEISPKNNTPIGTGPYKFVEYREDEYIRLQSNRDWWNSNKKGEGEPDLPHIEEINIKVYTKGSSYINAFQAGEIDIIEADKNNWYSYSGRTDVILKKYVSNRFEFVAFNLSNKILEDKEVRRAISLAIDRNKIINDIMPGGAVMADLPIIPDTFMYDTNTISYEKDIEESKNILSESGWKERGGLLYKRINGINTSLTLELLVNTDNGFRLEMAEEIKRQLEEIGVILNISAVGWEQVLDKIKTHKFDMVLTGCTVTSIPDISFLYSSSEIGIGINIAGYSEQVVDNYLERILKENDPAMKKAYFINMKETITGDIPYIGLFFYYDAIVYSKRVRGKFGPSAWNKYEDFTRWYIPDIG